MDEEIDEKVYLIYYQSRGLCQPIRYLLYEIGVDFEEIFLGINKIIPKNLQMIGINLNNIPCLIHEGKVISEYFPMLKYLCRKFNRTDLFGRTIQHEAKINETMIRYLKQRCKVFTFFFGFMCQAKKNPQNIQTLKVQMMEQLVSFNTYFVETPKLYIESGTFLFGYFTILDMVFYESCFYFSGLFSDICKKKYPIYLTYKNFFEKTEFYLKNKDRIEKYPILMPSAPEDIREGFKLMWVGDKKYFS